ncbi:TROVE domain-containing protein [Hugenholtzia roseola]|uniref:TROVE domain-containing protein n=1 Tax=Hugenholtzia roseola TaxID=1002 RepID=UPI0004146215|nr:TROVE domain-containing protein [Hugenholtzia roseola]
MRFNQKASKNTPTNYEGAPAYPLSPALELYAATVATSLSDKFYENNGKRIARLVSLIGKNDPLFVAQLAVYAREQMYLRSIPLVLAVELAKVHRGDDLVSRLVSRVVNRADEITELLAYYQASNERAGIKKLGKLSKQIQKGLALAFNKFDEYQFAKYNRATEIKLRDALFLSHPKAKDAAQQAIFDKITNNTLETPYTWEVELSVLGQQSFSDENEKAAAFRQKWEELIDSKKVGYMAILRNLRNILAAQVSAAHLQKVADYIGNKNAVLQSKQFPFRFLAAYRELLYSEYPNKEVFIAALERAALWSAENVQGFDAQTRVLLACDVSGSMHWSVSEKSVIQQYDIGLVLAMLLKNRCQTVVSGLFGNIWKIIDLPQTQILANTEALRKREGEVGYSTNGHLILKDLITRKVVMDKILIFTDCQLWNSQYTEENLATYWNEYKSKIAPNAKLYLFDLAGYGSLPLEEAQKDVFLIAGWSDKVFAMMEALEAGGEAVQQIQKIEL